MAHRRQAVAVLLGASLLAGCGGSSQPPENPSALANQRLQGSWQLLAFRPSLELEAPLKGLLDAQLSALTLNFNNGQFTAVGPGVDTGGRYEITSASGDTLTGRVYDRAGAGYGITGEFSGDQFRFTSTDTPWVGTGTLQRVK